MDQTLILVAVSFAVAVALLSALTIRRRGPFAFVLARLHADRHGYVSVATSLGAVAAGLIALPFFAWLWPSETSRWGSIAFIALASLANALRPMFTSRSA